MSESPAADDGQEFHEHNSPNSVVQAMLLEGRTRNLNLWDPTPLSHLPGGKLPLEIPDHEIEEGARRARGILEDLNTSRTIEEEIWDDLGLPGHIDDWETEIGGMADATEGEARSVQREDYNHIWDGTEEVYVEEEDEMGDWPRRLLHVPTMTSHTWQPGNMYNTVSCPDYAVISYTWGRWRLKPGEQPGIGALDIKGTTWPIPRVDECIFTLEQFKRALLSCMNARRPRVNLEWLWLDVACINQNRGDPEGALEIGRQARIFRNARERFIWLASNGAVSIATRDPLEDISRLQNTQNLVWQFEGLASDAMYKQDGRKSEDVLIEQLDQNIDLINDVTKNIRNLVAYPWFTSLWTLQEAFLSLAAIFIDYNGDIVANRPVYPPRLIDVLRVIGVFFQASSIAAHLRAIRNTPKSIEEQVLRRVIERAGLASLWRHNAVALYTQSKYRTTQEPLDRIYGIMQVFDIRLGKTSPHADPKHEWTLEELEVQLGVALIQKYPILSQLHLHSTLIRGRQAWRLTTESVVPAWSSQLHFDYPKGQVDRMASSLGVKKVDGSCFGYFDGKTCDFETFVEAWRSECAKEVPTTSTGNILTSSTSVTIALDLTVLFSRTSLQIKWQLWEIPRGQAQLDLATSMIRRIRVKGLKVIILCLGGIAAPELTLNGLILLECLNEKIGRWYARLGICTWDIPYPAGSRPPPGEFVIRHETPHCHWNPVLAGETKDWEHRTGIFG